MLYKDMEIPINQMEDWKIKEHYKHIDKYLGFTTKNVRYCFIESQHVSELIKPCLRIKPSVYILQIENSTMTLSACSDLIHFQNTCEILHVDYLTGLHFSCKVPFEMLQYLANTPARQKIMIAYNYDTDHLIFVNTATGHKSKYEVDNENVAQPIEYLDSGLPKGQHKRIAVNRKSLIQALQSMYDDVVYLNYKPTNNTFHITSIRRQADIKCNLEQF
jgi:hypothetical protein